MLIKKEIIIRSSSTRQKRMMYIDIDARKHAYSADRGVWVDDRDDDM